MGRFSLTSISISISVLAVVFTLATTAEARKVFPADHDSVTLEDDAGDRAHLPVYQDLDEVARDVNRGILVPVSWVYVSPRLPGERRFLRPAASDSLGWLDFEFYVETGGHLVLDSAIRPVTVQQRLMRLNRNAAPAIGMRASSHERGTTFDVSRKMTRGEYRWLLVRLLYYRGIGRVFVIEEKNCIHICVRED